jgi:hypothetical protein
MNIKVTFKAVMKKCFLITLFVWSFFCISYAQEGDTIFKSFTAVQVDNGVLLKFTIVGGVTCSGVKVQRSADNINFTTIHEFVGVCGSLNTDESYSFTDEQPVVNNYGFYRLDMSSIGLFSNSIFIKFIGYDKNGITVFPNPCTSSCTIYFANSSALEHEILLYNSSGKLLISEFTNGSLWRLSDSVLPKGIYFYKIIRENAVRFNGRLAVF